MAKEVGGGDGVEEVGSDGEGDAVGVVLATMTTMTTEMLATRAMVTMMATMTSVMETEIMAMVEGTASDGTGKNGVGPAIDDGLGKVGMVGTAMATLLTVVPAVELRKRRPVILTGGPRC